MPLENHDELLASFLLERVSGPRTLNYLGLEFPSRAAFNAKLDAYVSAAGHQNVPREILQFCEVGYESLAGAVALEEAVFIARALSLEGVSYAPAHLRLTHQPSAARLIADEWEVSLNLVERMGRSLLGGPYGEALARAISALQPSDVYSDIRLLGLIERAMRERDDGAD
jgi:hypothetical protein